MKLSANKEEIEKFARHSSKWWDEAGPFKPLHDLNPVRLSYIKEQITNHYGLGNQSLTALKGLKIIDIGCGGGLVSEPLSRLGAKVTGVDADENAIAIAKNHAEGNNLKIDYKACTAESLLPKQSGKFDVVIALEIIEHIDNPQSFIDSCAELCKPGGLVILSTLNRTPQSYALGIVAAENILGWVPRGTHDWNKFIKPSELSSYFRQSDLTPHNVEGYSYDMLNREFKRTKNKLGINYFMTAAKP